MEQSNISRDRIALEAMKAIMDKTTHEILTPWQRLRRFAGLRYDSAMSNANPKIIALKAYQIADAMVAGLEKQTEG